MGEINKSRMIQLDINNADVLYKSYMSFVNTGGIYFFSQETMYIGDEIFLVLTLDIDQFKQKYPMETDVVWKNVHTTVKSQQGYGVAFRLDEIGLKAKKNIETFILENCPDTMQPTFTM